jgi:hypothetical protein
MRLSEAEFVRRGPRIQQLLRPLSPWATGPAWARKPLGTSLIVIGTHDGANPTSNYRDWRFSTNAKRHHAMYFESWRIQQPRNSLVLEQAYLNVYEKTQTGEREIVCLHCDPSLLPAADHAKYKRGPHIHMSVAGSPFDSAHIALQGPDLTPVLRSTDALHRALSWGVEMICDEIISLILSEQAS